MGMRPHGVFADADRPVEGLVEGVCVWRDVASSTVRFTVPSFSADYEYGPAPAIGPDLPPLEARVLVAFPSSRRPWVIGWTDQP